MKTICYKGHRFVKTEKPKPDTSGNPGSLAYVFSPETSCYRCLACDLLIGFKGKDIKTTDMIEVGWGSFDNTDSYWKHPNWTCVKG